MCSLGDYLFLHWYYIVFVFALYLYLYLYLWTLLHAASEVAPVCISGHYLCNFPSLSAIYFPRQAPTIYFHYLPNAIHPICCQNSGAADPSQHNHIISDLFPTLLYLKKTVTVWPSPPSEIIILCFEAFKLPTPSEPLGPICVWFLPGGGYNLIPAKC